MQANAQEVDTELGIKFGMGDARSALRGLGSLCLFFASSVWEFAETPLLHRDP